MGQESSVVGWVSLTWRFSQGRCWHVGRGCTHVRAHGERPTTKLTRVLVDRTQFFSCLQRQRFLAVLSFLKANEPESKEGCVRQKVRPFWYLILEVTPHRFFYIVFIRSESLGTSPHLRGGGYTKAWVPGDGNPWGPSTTNTIIPHMLSTLFPFFLPSFLHSLLTSF